MSSEHIQQKVSDDPSHYAKFVIYIKRNITVCEELRNLCLPHNDIIIQEIDHIQGQKPAWLLGVPTVIKLPEYSVYTGTEALTMVRKYLSETITPITSDHINNIGGTQIAENNISDLPLRSDPRYDETPPENLGKISLEDMMRRRG